MRTGAIFARGSCRALKWVALFGAVFALGAGSAFAQATFTSAEWTPESNMIKLTMSADVWSRSPSDVAKDFTVSWGTGADAMEAAGTASTIPSSESGADDEFMITLDKAIPTGAGGDDGSTGITVAYDGPVGDTDVTDARINAEGILDNSAAHAASADSTGITTAENTDGAPMIEAVEAKTFRNGVEITAFQLPTAKGNQPFTYLASNLPAGLTWDADGADDTAGNADDRMISGTPSAVTDGAHMVTYTVTDRAPRSDATSITFAITVNDAPDTPEKPTVTPTTNTAGSLDVMWEAPMANNSPILYYEVQHKATEATDWVVPNTRVLSGTRHTFSGLTDGMSYDFRVRAINAVGMSDYSATTMGTPMASEAVPAAPAAPTITASARGSLTVMWAAPADNGSAIIDYALRHKTSSGSDWTTKSEAVTGRSATLTGLSDATMYDVQVRARNANGEGPWSPSGQGTTMAAPAGPDPTAALITKIEISGSQERRIGGVDRLHVGEGDRADVSVTVEWTKADLRAIHDAPGNPQDAYVYLVATPVVDAADWLSPAEVTNVDGQDVPDRWEGIRLPLPKRPKDTDPGRDTVSVTESVQHTWLNDADAEDEALTLGIDTATSRGVSFGRDSKLVTDTIVIDDDETQGIKLEQTSKGAIYEGGADVEFEVSADPELVQLTIDVGFDLLDADGAPVPSRAYGLSPARDSIGAGDDKIEVAVDLDDNDGNREDDVLTLRAEIASRNRDDIKDASMSFTVLDVHRLPLLSVSPMTDTVTEGDELELTLTIDRNPAETIAIDPETRRYTSEAIEVMLTGGAGTTAGMSDYELPAMVTFEKHNKKAPWTQSMKVKVMAKEDDDLDDGEMLVIDAMVAGAEAANGEAKESYAGLSSLTIEESTGKLVWARSADEVEAAVMAAKKAGMGDDMMFTAGEMIELEGNDLFGSAEGVSVGYTATVEGDAVSESVSGGVVTITADSMGMAKVTITARASRPSGAVMINDQTDPREASITVTLEVGLVALSIMLSGPEDMNLVEGGMGGMVTATANRAVTEDTMVTLMRDRSMSSADDMDYTVEPITIMAGQMSGSTMVMATADDMMENDDNMPEELVLYGMAADNAGEVSGEVKFYLWDAAVPALPIVAQLLLAALLGLGGYRRYRRR